MNAPSGLSSSPVWVRVSADDVQTAPSASMRDAVRADAVGPHPPVRQAAVGGDVEGGEAAGEGLGDDQRGVVGRDDHAVGELDAVGDLAGRAVRCDQGDDARLRRLAGPEVEAQAVEVDVAAAVDDDLVPAVAGDAAQVDVAHHRPVGLPAHAAPCRSPAAGRRAASRSTTRGQAGPWPRPRWCRRGRRRRSPPRPSGRTRTGRRASGPTRRRRARPAGHGSSVRFVCDISASSIVL